MGRGIVLSSIMWAAITLLLVTTCTDEENTMNRTIITAAVLITLCGAAHAGTRLATLLSSR